MDIATVIGLALVTVAIIGSIMSGGPLSIFIDVASIFVVGGGVVAATFIKWPMQEVTSLIGIVMKTFFFKASDPKKLIERIQELSEIARRKSIFELEKEPIEDEFLKKAARMAADNKPAELVMAQLQLEIDAMESRHGKGVDIVSGIGDDGPAFGMIGTLIGLVQMLQNLSDPSAIGPAMAVALLTTFYGAVLANAFALPMANKLKIRSQMELTNMSIIVAGIMGIIAGENPKNLRAKLDSFLPPGDRVIEEAEA